MKTKRRKQPFKQLLGITAGAWALTAGGSFALTIEDVQPANVTPSEFDVFVRLSETAESRLEVYADAAGASSLVGVVGTEDTPVWTGDPAVTTHYYRREIMRGIQDGAEAKGLALHRVSGCAPQTDYYIRVVATNSAGSVMWPTSGLYQVTTELENDLVLESRQLLITLEGGLFDPAPEGAVGVLTADGASYPLASLVGDSAQSNQLYFDLSGLFASTSRVNMVLGGTNNFNVELFGPAGQAALLSSFSINFSNITEVARLETGNFTTGGYVLEIRSVAGTATPATGFYTNDYGTVIACSIAETNITDGTSRQIMEGWTLAGGAPGGGAGTAVNVTMTNDMVLTWEWQTQHQLTTFSGPNGQVNPPSMWVDEGDVITITAQPDVYYGVDYWGGILDGTTENGESIDVPMTKARFVYAFFAENYTSNGIPQRWVYENGLTNNWETADTLDQDGDGMLTWEEYIAGTSPTNEAESLEVKFDSISTNVNTLVWSSVAEKEYRVWRSTDLTGSFMDISGPLSATPPINTYNDNAPPAGLPTYYRISVENP